MKCDGCGKDLLFGEVSKFKTGEQQRHACGFLMPDTWRADLRKAYDMPATPVKVTHESMGGWVWRAMGDTIANLNPMYGHFKGQKK